jgi:mannose-6-phosphate isomerase-like protein (cupin superfamily)
MKESHIAFAASKTETAAQPANQQHKSTWLQNRPGERCLIRTAAEDTNGIYSVVEILSEPGDGTPVHVHQNEDEYLIVLEGKVRIVNGEETFDAQPATAIALRKGINHAWNNPANSQLRMLAIMTPGGIEHVLRVTAEGGDVMALWERFGVRFVGPMPS